MTKLKFKGKSNILKKTSSGINPTDFSLAVKEAAQCPIDTCGGGLGSGDYLYKEINISSAEILNPGVLPDSDNGVVLLQQLPSNQYYDWYLYWEYTPGTILYSNAADIALTIDIGGSNFGSLSFMNTKLASDLDKRVWQASSKGHEYIYPTTLGGFLYAKWGGGLGSFLDGNGSFKVKIYYKVLNFG